jgi:hypothetical protein
VQQSGSGSNLTAIHGAVSFFRLLTNYAGIANCPFFDLASFDLLGKRGTVRAGCARATAGTGVANFAVNSYRFAFYWYSL